MTGAELCERLFQSAPPREGGDEHIEASHGDLDISIHAPREGGDINEATTVYTDSVFQSTPPARGATLFLQPRQPLPVDFNPRPPRGGRLRGHYVVHLLSVFNPRPPRGGRLRPTPCASLYTSFQSTPPARGATLSVILTTPAPAFQSTPPRGGRPSRILKINSPNGYFNPRPREGGDAEGAGGTRSVSDFNPRPREGGDLVCGLAAHTSQRFQSTPPARGATNI